MLLQKLSRRKGMFICFRRLSIWTPPFLPSSSLSPSTSLLSFQRGRHLKGAARRGEERGTIIPSSPPLSNVSIVDTLRPSSEDPPAFSCYIPGQPVLESKENWESRSPNSQQQQRPTPRATITPREGEGWDQESGPEPRKRVREGHGGTTQSFRVCKMDCERCPLSDGQRLQ